MKNTGLNVLGLIIPSVIFLASVPVVIRFLGTERFGLFSIVLTVFSYFVLFDLGLGRASVKFTAEALGRGNMDDLPRIMWTTVGVQAVFGMIGSAVMIAAAPFLAERILKISAAHLIEAKASLVYMALSLPFAIVTPAVRGILEAGQRFELVNAVKIPTNSVIYLIPLVAAPLGMDLPGIILLLSVSRALTLVVWIWLAFRTYPILRERKFLPRARMRSLFSFGGWNALGTFVWFSLINADRVVLSSQRGLTQVGFYSGPAEAIQRMLILPGSLAMTLFPAFSSLQGRGDAERAKNLYTRSLKFTLLSLGPPSVGLIALSGFILRIWLGPEIAIQSRLVLQLMSLGFLFSALAYIPNSFLQGIGRADLQTKILLFELVFFAPMLWFGIRWFGINGAAGACAVRVIVDLILLLGASSRIGKIPLRHLIEARILRIGAALVIYAAALFGAKALPAAPVWIFVSSAAFVFWAWRSALTESERDGCLDIIGRYLSFLRKKT